MHSIVKRTVAMTIGAITVIFVASASLNRSIKDIFNYQYKQTEIRKPHLTVYGIAERVIQSDIANLTITISNDVNSTKDASISANNKIVREYLLKCGIKASEIKKVTKVVEDRADQYNHKKKTNLDVNRYIVKENIYVTTYNIEAAKAIIEKQSELSELRIEINQNFKYKNVDHIRAELIEEATRDLKARATKAIMGLDCKLASINNCNVDDMRVEAFDDSAEAPRYYWDSTDEKKSIMKKVSVKVTGDFIIIDKIKT